MIEKRFKNIKICFLSTGIGAGSKLLQSYIDGTKEVLMIPSYILMYLYPNWVVWKKKNKLIDWETCLKKLLTHHPALLNTSILPGSSDLDKLGDNKRKSISINKKNFKSKFLYFTKKEKVNFKNFIIAIHLAYAKCTKQNLMEKKLLFFHAHDPDYINEMLKIFPEAKILSMYRDIRDNLPGRVNSSLNKINEKYLNNTDVFLMNISSYRKSLLRNYIGIHSIKAPIIENHRIVSYVDLINKKEKTLKKVFNFLNIKFLKKINLQQTFLGFKWNSQFYNKKQKQIKNKENFFFKWELLWLRSTYSIFLNKYEKKKIPISYAILTLPLVFLPSKYEVELIKKVFSYYFIKFFFSSTINEISSKKNILYKKWGYYEFKWYSKNYPFSFKNFFISKINQKKNVFIWHNVYFLLKICEYLILPLCIFVNYFLRASNCVFFFLSRDIF